MKIEHILTMSGKYNLLSNNDGNELQELEASSFQEAVEESLVNLGWYVIDEGDCLVGVNDSDSNNTIELTEPFFEDGQYELIEKLGYYITSPVTV